MANARRHGYAVSSLMDMAYWSSEYVAANLKMSNSRCAAFKYFHRKCIQECVFAPYFPPDQPAKFASVHKVFGSSNVARILNELSTSHRQDAVNSLLYEADARLRDPVYGYAGIISSLVQEIELAQIELAQSKADIALLGAAQLNDLFIYNEQN
ncbi:LOB domain-containing protein 36-like protein [Tanacetum coccineum]